MVIVLSQNIVETSAAGKLLSQFHSFVHSSVFAQKFRYNNTQQKNCVLFSMRHCATGVINYVF